MKITPYQYIKNVLSDLPNSIYWKDINGVYIGANTHAAHMAGFNSVEDLIGKTDYDFTSKKQADFFRKNDIKVMSEDKEICIEESFFKDDINLIQLSTKKSIKDTKDNIVGVMGITINVSDMKHKESNLLKKTMALEEALSEKKRFLNNLSHEIHTPLHVINSITQELYRNINCFSKEEFSNLLLVLMKNNERLIKLVANLLEIAKSTQRKSSYCFQKKDILITLHEAISEFSPVASISLKANYKTAFVNIDEFKISQVLRNLINNAIKYGPNEDITIELKKMKEKKGILVQVKNKSIGVLEEERTKVFDPFFQGSNSRTQAGGTGLGLSLCKEIIFAHKGSIWIEQDKLNMTCVNFSIPYAKQ
jgi:signal transduction histidine kinase